MNSRLRQNQNWPELARRANWSAALLAKRCGVSVRTLHRYFLGKFRMSTRDWLAADRQRCGLELLPESQSIKDVAAEIGYKHPETFSRGFKRHWGKRPSEVVLAHPAAPFLQQMSA